MTRRSISWPGVLLRMAAGLVVVLGTWNPSGHSFFHWVTQHTDVALPIKAFLGALLLCAWILCIRAASTSLGSLGFALCALVLGTLIWMLTDIGILHDEAPSFALWAGLVVLGTILGVGLSWSLIRERTTGQVEVD
jgi:hypothetical protein